MISQSTKKGTVVFSEVFGLGRFVGFLSTDSQEAIVQFEDETHIVHRKRLIEIESSHRNELRGME